MTTPAELAAASVPPGWRALIRIANIVATTVAQRPVELSDDAGAWLALSAPVDVDEVDEKDAINGVIAAAAALSREICAGCGAGGDPVRTVGGALTTRCVGCRQPGVRGRAPRAA